MALTLLRTYADRVDPNTLPPTVKLCHTDFSLVVFDKYPKAHFHFLLLPFIRPPLRAADLRDLAALLRLPREQAKAVLQNIRHDALAAKKLVEDEMVRSYGFKWGIQMGFHAVPSLEHLHLHIISDEFRGQYMKNKKHLNSFHPRLGFFLHIDEVLSWFEPDVAPTWFAMKSNIDKKEYEKLLKEDMTCPHCDNPFKTIVKLTDHLHLIWKRKIEEHEKRAAQEAQAAENKAVATKRKHGESDNAGESDPDDENARPLKRLDTGLPAADPVADPAA
ncbi:hypothetical protein C8Q74DRAFT_1228002 [Fomes fomentarius]|nr:hypothetical protein C8Q74DRAFT_1228002 [Fomes fomentarius]